MALIFTAPRYIPTTANGIVPGARLYFYQTGTTTPQAVYTDSALTIPHDQPVEAFDDGSFPVIYLNESGPAYKVVLTDSAGETLPGGADPYTTGITGAEIRAQLYPRSAAEISASVVPVDESYPHGDLRRYWTSGDIGTALAAAASTGHSPLIIPEGDYNIAGGVVTLSTAGQILQGAGRGLTRLRKSSNGAAITIAANYVKVVDIDISNNVGATYTGPNIAGTGTRTGVVLEEVNSVRSLSYCIDLASFQWFHLLNCYCDNAGATPGTPNVRIGESNTGTYSALYGTIIGGQYQPSGNPIELNAVGTSSIQGAQIGGLTVNVAGGSATGISCQSNRILGPVSVESSGHTFIGNAFGAYTVTFETGSSGCWFVANVLDGSTVIVDSGTTNNILSYDGNGQPYFSKVLRFNNNVGSRFYNQAGDNYALINMTTGNNFSILNNSGAIQFNASNGYYQFASLPTSASGLPSGAIWNDTGTLRVV